MRIIIFQVVRVFKNGKLFTRTAKKYDLLKMSVYVAYNVLPYNIIYTMQTSFGQAVYIGSVTTV